MNKQHVVAQENAVKGGHGMSGVWVLETGSGDWRLGERGLETWGKGTGDWGKGVGGEMS
jgi:hypothetical protein